MDKEIVNESQLNEAKAIARFKELANYKHPKQSLKRLYEYTFINPERINGSINEEGEDENPNADAQGQGMPQNGAPDAANQMGGMNDQMGGEMPQNDSQMTQDGQQMPQAPAPDMGMQPPMDGGDMNQGQGDEMGGEEMPPMDDMPAEDEIETEEMEGGDEVIDVDELTQSQEATEYKLDGVDDRLTKIYDIVQQFSDQLDRNEQNISALKAEFEKRNPTEEEKLNLRSLTSFPYSETPKGYWEKKAEENPNYNIKADNDVAPNDEQGIFEITKDDIRGLDMKSIADSLNVDQDLQKYLGF